MAEFKGTKGKWKISKTPEYHEPKCSKVEVFSEESPNFWICKIQNNGLIEKNEGNANALLISKAPEMLEMLKQCVETLEFSENIGFTYDEVKQLIKEATELKD